MSNGHTQTSLTGLSFKADLYPSNGHRVVNTRLVFHSDPSGLAVEQYRLVRNRLRTRFGNGGVVMITSPAPGDGKTLNSLNLACCLDEGGGGAILAEMDLRRPAIASTLGCTIDPPGIESALAKDVKPEAALHRLSGCGVYISAVSQAPVEPTKLLAGEVVTDFLQWARKEFRWVVLDCPPVFPASDIAELAPFADALLMVIRARTTPRALAQKAIERLGDRLHGVIFNEATVCHDSYYRYLSGYYGKRSYK